MRYIDMFPSTDSRGYVSENVHTQMTFILSSRPKTKSNTTRTPRCKYSDDMGWRLLFL